MALLCKLLGKSYSRNKFLEFEIKKVTNQDLWA